ncbi:MAG: hypothetical protein A3F10_07410 [Coxiella sp. RIFCSPHIGHO2_12_FULL_42_15]|nr:MAG: hypothetical protein A3F10_07410 [Coxiella sp. RIFCSPHIGHO2_12_FULL_42_15]
MQPSYKFSDEKYKKLLATVREKLQSEKAKKSSLFGPRYKYQALEEVINVIDRGENSDSHHYHLLLSTLYRMLKTTNPGVFSGVSTRRDFILNQLAEQFFPANGYSYGEWARWLEEEIKELEKQWTQQIREKIGKQEKGYDYETYSFPDDFDKEFEYILNKMTYRFVRKTKEDKEAYILQVKLAEKMRGYENLYTVASGKGFEVLLQKLEKMLNENEPGGEMELCLMGSHQERPIGNC